MTGCYINCSLNHLIKSSLKWNSITAFVRTNHKTCLNISVIHDTFNNKVLIQKVYDLVPTRVDKTDFPHMLCRRNENTIVNNNKMSRLMNSTKDGLFYLQNTVKSKGKGTWKMTSVFLAEILTTHMIQYKMCHIYIIASCLLLC